MEWHVKKSCCHKKAERLYIVLCDSGGSLKMLAEAQSFERVKPGDLLSPLKDAQYCVNRDVSRVIKIIDARQYICDEWERLLRLSADKWAQRRCLSAGRKIVIKPAMMHSTPTSAFTENVPCQPGRIIDATQTST